MDNLLHQMGERIAARRKQRRITQEELAEATGVTPQTISTAELGIKDCDQRISLKSAQH